MNCDDSIHNVISDSKEHVAGSAENREMLQSGHLDESIEAPLDFSLKRKNIPVKAETSIEIKSEPMMLDFETSSDEKRANSSINDQHSTMLFSPQSSSAFHRVSNRSSSSPVSNVLSSAVANVMSCSADQQPTTVKKPTPLKNSAIFPFESVLLNAQPSPSNSSSSQITRTENNDVDVNNTERIDETNDPTSSLQQQNTTLTMMSNLQQQAAIFAAALLTQHHIQQQQQSSSVLGQGAGGSTSALLNNFLGGNLLQSMAAQLTQQHHQAQSSQVKENSFSPPPAYNANLSNQTTNADNHQTNDINSFSATSSFLETLRSSLSANSSSSPVIPPPPSYESSIYTATTTTRPDHSSAGETGSVHVSLDAKNDYNITKEREDENVKRVKQEVLDDEEVVSDRTVDIKKNGKDCRREVTIITDNNNSDDPLMDHFKRSLGAVNYQNVFSTPSSHENGKSFNEPSLKKESEESKLQRKSSIDNEKENEKKSRDKSDVVKQFEEDMKSESGGYTVEDHFAKALGDTWVKLQENTKQNAHLKETMAA